MSKVLKWCCDEDVVVGDLERKLALVKDVKKFCIERLGVAKNDSYTCRVEDIAFYELFVSSRKTIETLIYPFSDSPIINKIQRSDMAGVLNYDNLRYDSLERCVKTSKFLDSSGYDTYIRKVNNYIENDGLGETTQIHPNLLMRKDIVIAELVAHENFHIHVRKNDVDMASELEEPCADNFAYDSLMLYYKSDAAKTREVLEEKSKMDRFYKWYWQSIKRLCMTYSRSYEEGRKELHSISEEYDFDMPFDFETGLRLKNSRINNAFFLSMLDYSMKRSQVQKILKGKNPRVYLKKIAKAEEIETLKQLRDIVRI